MQSQSYSVWTSIYNKDMETIWDREKTELRKISMIYCAFQKELDRLKIHLSDELSVVKTALKRKNYLEKCKKFTGLVESVPFDIPVFDISEKENQSPKVELRDNNTDESHSEVFFIDKPESPRYCKETTPPPLSTSITAASPVLRKDSFKFKRKLSKTSLEITKTPTERKSSSFKTPKFNDSNILDCSIVEDTPDIKTDRKSRKLRLKLKSKKSSLDKSKQGTLTQLFFQPKKSKKEIDSHLPSMTITEMMNLINESSSSDDTDTDATVDLEVSQTTTNSPEEIKINNQPDFVFNEVVRGKERMKLKGWACNECKSYYESLNLPLEELQKKMDQCSKHRHKFKPREDTFDGFWDLSFKPTPRTQPQDDEKSLVLNYKK